MKLVLQAIFAVSCTATLVACGSESNRMGSSTSGQLASNTATSGQAASGGPSSSGAATVSTAAGQACSPNTPFDPNSLKQAYIASVPMGGGVQIAVIASSNPNLCMSGSLVVDTNSTDLVAFGSPGGGGSNNWERVPLMVDIHDAAGAAGLCTLFGENSNGTSFLSGTAGVVTSGTLNAETVTFNGAVLDRASSPNFTQTFSLQLPVQMCVFPTRVDPNNNVVACQPSAGGENTVSMRTAEPGAGTSARSTQGSASNANSPATDANASSITTNAPGLDPNAFAFAYDKNTSTLPPSENPYPDHILILSRDPNACDNGNFYRQSR